MTYQEFIQTKLASTLPKGMQGAKIHSALYDFQKDTTEWALGIARAAIFADCGMGKTIMQCEWARHVAMDGDVLIVAPLAVAPQTIDEASLVGLKVNRCYEASDIQAGVNICNYDRVEKMLDHKWQGIVLDESSILKSYTGKFRNLLIEGAQTIPFRLGCTATPAPNDFMELGNHAEFLGVMKREEMLAMYFVHDGGETQKWRLKGHAEGPFWSWLSSWARAMRKPSDLGYDDGNFNLPPLHYEQHVVESSALSAGMLFAMPASSMQERLEARRSSVTERCKKAAELINATNEPFLAWCNLNTEAEELARLCPGSVNVQGSDSPAHKEEAMLGFSSGKIRVLITKPSIAGFGMNWQHCNQMVFVGLNDSFEQMYQAVRRCWRFGQKKPVTAHIVISQLEGAVLRNVMRKEEDATRMAEEIVKHMKEKK